MEFDSVIEKRKSVRSFKKKGVNWRDVLESVESVCQGPFADSRNNLKFLIIEDPEKIEKIAKFAEQEWMGEAPILVAVCSDDTNLENLHGERGRVYSRQQAGSAINTFLLKLTDLSLASCWVGSFSDELIKQILDIPSHIQIEAIIPIGHSASKVEKREKKELEHSIFWEKWDRRKRPSLIAEGSDNYSVIE